MSEPKPLGSKEEYEKVVNFCLSRMNEILTTGEGPFYRMVEAIEECKRLANSEGIKIAYPEKDLHEMVIKYNTRFGPVIRHVENKSSRIERLEERLSRNKIKHD